MEVRRISRKYHYATRPIGNQFVRIENRTEANVENTCHDGVDTVFGMGMGHQSGAIGHFDSYNIGCWLARVAGDDSQFYFLWECGKAAPFHVFIMQGTDFVEWQGL
ncbi:hypothetical protein PU99_14035 [Pseudomonas putida]|nr:hypothetical protein PU99_14035 [Pseudomonas putida]OMQ30491.1 hypothetical protein BKX96_27265 [Pseudomonas putida]